MSAFQQTVKKETSDLALFLCPRQPGNLRISKHACALRYRKAQDLKCNRFGHGYGIVYKWSFETCQICPEGRHNAEEIFGPKFGKISGNN